MENETFWFEPQDYTHEEQHVFVVLAWAAFGAQIGCAADEVQDDLTVARLARLED